jgi:hypothetical protein
MKHWILQEPHGVTSQKVAFFKRTAVKTSNVTITRLGNVSGRSIQSLQYACMFCSLTF